MLKEKMYFQNQVDQLLLENGKLRLEALDLNDLEPEKLKNILGEDNVLV